MAQGRQVDEGAGPDESHGLSPKPMGFQFPDSSFRILRSNTVTAKEAGSKGAFLIVSR
jgi:hypothetical protein